MLISESTQGLAGEDAAIGSGDDASSSQDANFGSGDASITPQDASTGDDALVEADDSDAPVWQPVQALSETLTWEVAGDVGLWFDSQQGVLYGSRASLEQLDMQMQSRMFFEPFRSAAEIRRSVYAAWELGNLADTLAAAETKAEGDQKCVATCYYFAERLKAFPWKLVLGPPGDPSTPSELTVKFTGNHGRQIEPGREAHQAAAFGVQLELICEYTEPCAGNTLQCGVDLNQTIGGSLKSHAKVEWNANPWGFGNRPEAKAEQTVKAGFFKKGESKPVELEITQQAESRVSCGYDDWFTALASECAVVNQTGLNYKCTWQTAVLKVAKMVYQCARSTDREKQEGTTLSGGYTEDRFLVELPFSPKHTRKHTTTLGQTHVTYGRRVRVKDNNDYELTHFATAIGNVTINLKAENFAVKGGSAVGGVCQGAAQNGGFLSLTLEAKPSAPPSRLPTEKLPSEIVPCKDVGTKVEAGKCLSQGECITSADGHVFVLQTDGRAVVYDTNQLKFTYFTPGSSWPADRTWQYVCVQERTERVDGGGLMTATVAVGIMPVVPTAMYPDSRPIDEGPLRAFDRTCGTRPYLTLEKGKLVLMRDNGFPCRRYELPQ